MADLGEVVPKVLSQMAMLRQLCLVARYAGVSGDDALRSKPLSKSRWKCQRTSRTTEDPVKVW
jgi:hypothetical protein